MVIFTLQIPIDPKCKAIRKYCISLVLRYLSIFLVVPKSYECQEKFWVRAAIKIAPNEKKKKRKKDSTKKRRHYHWLPTRHDIFQARHCILLLKDFLPGLWLLLILNLFIWWYPPIYLSFNTNESLLVINNPKDLTKEIR